MLYGTKIEQASDYARVTCYGSARLGAYSNSNCVLNCHNHNGRYNAEARRIPVQGRGECDPTAGHAGQQSCGTSSSSMGSAPEQSDWHASSAQQQTNHRGGFRREHPSCSDQLQPVTNAAEEGGLTPALFRFSQ